MKAIEVLKDKINNNTNFFILDSHASTSCNISENPHNDIDFKYYNYNTRQHNKLSKGDLFIYRKPNNSTKNKKFFFYGVARVKDIVPIDDSRNVKAILDLGYKFKDPIYQGCDFLENTMKWTFKTKGNNWKYFFTQYGMTLINKEDFFNLLKFTELYPAFSHQDHDTLNIQISNDIKNSELTNKHFFELYLTNILKKSKKTLQNYSSAINTISKDMSNLYDSDINIYDISNPDVVCEIKESYLTTEFLKEKNIRGNNMYTASLNAYNKFLYSQPIVNSINYKPKAKGKFKIEKGIKKWNRNPLIVSNVLSNNNYVCEYDSSHKFFISKKTSHNYVEGHHLIPMSLQDSYIYSLDTEANIISLCPVCHKLLHFGLLEDKKNILEKLYKSRYKKLLLSGIDISFDDLLLLYK